MIIFNLVDHRDIITLRFLLALGKILYTRFPKSCVDGHNIIKYPNKSVDECKNLCSLNVKCVAFEYGVVYGGSGGYKPRDCQLQDSSAKEGCLGAHHNLDLYVKGCPDIF